MQRQLELPKKISVKKKGAHFEVHWNYQNAPDAMAVRSKCVRLDGFIDGFIDGVLVALEIPNNNIYRLGSSTGAVKELNEKVAIKLATILTELFHPLVAAEHRKLDAYAKLLLSLVEQAEHTKIVNHSGKVGT